MSRKNVKNNFEILLNKKNVETNNKKNVETNNKKNVEINNTKSC
jgi:hypothetical protein